jgi:HD-like signal output (HDOD) protein
VSAVAVLTPDGLSAGIKDLVTLPDVAMRIARMVDDPSASASDIGREISSDAALTARLLRIANSAAYGQNRKIATISRAITVLGVRQVRDLTVGLTAVRAFDGISNSLVTMEVFWRHSVLCAVAAGQIAGRRESPRTESPFVAGLLHDIGQLVLYRMAPEAARKSLLMLADASDDVGLYACERSVLEFDHGAVGASLARNCWPATGACRTRYWNASSSTMNRNGPNCSALMSPRCILRTASQYWLKSAAPISPTLLR